MVNNLKTVFILSVLYTAVILGVAVFMVADDTSQNGNVVEYQQF